MDDELLESLESCLACAEEVEAALPERPSGANLINTAAIARLEWIRRQLATLTAKLKALQQDAEVGVNLSDMGFADPQEMQDLLDDMSIQISHLKAMALSLAKSLGLGL